MEQGGDGGQPDAEGWVGGEAERVEGGRGPAGCEVPGERGERGVGSLAGVERLGGRAGGTRTGGEEMMGFQGECFDVCFSFLFLFFFIYGISHFGKERWEEGIVSNMVFFPFLIPLEKIQLVVWEVR